MLFVIFWALTTKGKIRERTVKMTTDAEDFGVQHCMLTSLFKPCVIQYLVVRCKHLRQPVGMGRKLEFYQPT